MESLLRRGLIQFNREQPEGVVEQIMASEARLLALEKRHRPTMAKFDHWRTELVWLAWNFLINGILKHEWSSESVQWLQQWYPDCNEGSHICESILDFQDSLLKYDVERMVENEYRGPALGIQKCARKRWTWIGEEE